MPNTFSPAGQVQLSINRRWGIIDWNERFRWWRLPSQVRILMYYDGGVNFDGGSYLGLQYVSTLLKSRAYHYVNFQVDSAHRDGNDPTASIQGARKLTDLDIINQYDEIMFFGENPVPNLSPDEVAILDQFMAAPKFGGILVTGDHANLGQGISGQISRAGEMRQYPAPDSIPDIWNTTLEEGPDSNSSYDFPEQSDDKPQTIRCKLFSIGSSGFQKRYRPHPVFCGPNGIINILPDHQHEGEAIAPVPTPDSPQWPTKLGYQEAPEVIAWGSIKDPAADKYGQEIGVVSAYNGHNVDVGRILADSTWHHWFDINLTGVEALPSPYAGFDETPAGQEALKKIDAYFLNCAIWLAPPDRQAEMSYAAWWSILWSDAVVQLSPDTPILRLGEEAINALGQRSTRCSVADWILDIPIFKEKIPRWEWPQIFESFQLIDIPLEKFVAGGVVRQLMQEIGHMSPDARFPQEAPSDELLQSIISKGVDEGLSALTTHLQGETALVSKLMDNNFRLN